MHPITEKKLKIVMIVWCVFFLHLFTFVQRDLVEKLIDSTFTRYKLQCFPTFHPTEYYYTHQVFLCNRFFFWGGVFLCFCGYGMLICSFWGAHHLSNGNYLIFHFTILCTQTLKIPPKFFFFLSSSSH